MQSDRNTLQAPHRITKHQGWTFGPVLFVSWWNVTDTIWSDGSVTNASKITANDQLSETAFNTAIDKLPP